MADEATRPLWVRCRQCAHCWPAAWLPMEVGKIASLVGRAMCPKCGDSRPAVAKQARGILQEPGQPMTGKAPAAEPERRDA